MENNEPLLKEKEERFPFLDEESEELPTLVESEEESQEQPVPVEMKEEPQEQPAPVEPKEENKENAKDKKKKNMDFPLVFTIILSILIGLFIFFKVIIPFYNGFKYFDLRYEDKTTEK